MKKFLKKFVFFVLFMPNTYTQSIDSKLIANKNYDDHVLLEKERIINYSASNWMDEDFEVLKDKTLNEIVLPGSHDSGTYSLKLKLAPDAPPAVIELISKLGKFGLKKLALKIVKKWAEAQCVDIFSQLQIGMRYLDLRVMWNDHDNSFRMHHSLIGTNFLNVLRDIKTFSDNHPKEIIILDISTLNLDDDKYYNLFEMILNLLGFKLLAQDYNFSKTYAEIIKLKTPIVLFFDKQLDYSGDLFWDKKYLVSKWANVDNIEALYDIESKALKDYNDFNSIFKLQWILTPNVETILESLVPFSKVRSLRDLSGECNSIIEIFLLDNKENKINIIMLDFVNETNVLELARARNGKSN